MAGNMKADAPRNARELRQSFMYKQYYRHILALITCDFFLTLMTLILVSFFRPYLPGEELAPSQVIPHFSMYVLAPLSLTLVFSISGAYDFRTIPRLGKQFEKLVFSYALWSWFIVAALYFSYRETSRLLVIYFAISNFGVLTISRYLMWAFFLAAKNNAPPARIVIFGSAQSSSNIRNVLLNGLPSGYKLVGFSDFEQPDLELSDAPFLGVAGDLPEIVRKHNVDIVIISLDQMGLAQARPLVNQLIAVPVRVLLTQDYSTLPHLNLEIERIGATVSVGLLEPVIIGWDRLIKRAFDLAVTSVSLVIALPLMLLISIAIKLDSSGPVIFRAKRIGYAGKLFDMFKFRSMFEEGSCAPENKLSSDVSSEQIFKIRDDPRITRVGKFLRRWSLDELPQLFNVLKGDMSLVGPRPEQPFITKRYEPWQWQRIQVPPGITGWWQVSGRSELPMHLNTHLDCYYIANYSLLLDIRILAKTVLEVVKGRGAY